MEKFLDVFDVEVPGGGKVRCRAVDNIMYFDLDSVCRLCFDSYDLHVVVDSMVMQEYLRRTGDGYWTDIDGVRQLYRREDSHMDFGVIRTLREVRA